MAIKLRRPEPGEDRLSWLKNVPCSICVPDGKLGGKLDFQFKIMKPSELDAEINAEDQQKTYELVRQILVAVRGLKDEDGEDWPEDEQLNFVLDAPELVLICFKKYFEHTSSGEQRKKD